METVAAVSPGYSSLRPETTALERDSARDYFVIGNGLNSTVAGITDVAAVAAGAKGAVPASDDEARSRLGDDFAEALQRDRASKAARARSELSWAPSHPSLVDEFATGSYRDYMTAIAHSSIVDRYQEGGAT